MQKTTLQIPRLFERLLQDGKISRDVYDAALRFHLRSGAHPHEALLEVRAMSEQELLKALAQLYQTRFVSTERLARADIDPALFRMVSRKVADRLCVFPVLFNRETGELSVVAADLDDDALARQTQVASGAKSVKMYVARAAAIRAAIRRQYDGDSFAFGALLTATSVVGFDTGERKMPTEETALTKVGVVHGHERVLTEEDFERRSMAHHAPLEGVGGARPRPPSNAPLSRLTPVPLPLVPEIAPSSTSSAGAVTSLPPPPLSSPGALPAAPTLPSSSMPSSMPPSFAPLTTPPVPEVFALDVIQVLVTLLESNRGVLRGHSSQVARLMRQACERVGLLPNEIDAQLVAAYLHDLGKTSAYHLTALNVAEYEGHRVQAQKTYLSPLRLFEGVRLPKDTVETLTHLYERFDGQGFPDHLSGKDIPLGARLLAIVETFADLTQHDRNPFRKTLGAQEACDAIAHHKHRIFDPNLTDVFRASVLGDDLRKRLLEERHTVLLLDPDAEDTTILELRLVENGYDVLIARNVTDAMSLIVERDVDLVISEVELPNVDGFAFLEQLRQVPGTAELPLFFLTKRADRDSVHKGFGLGAADYVVKPASADVVVAKSRRVLSSRRSRVPRGVMGSLRELPPSEMIQLLSNGRKSGVLRLSSGGKVGEIAFVEGDVHDAKWNGVRGVDAFFSTLLLRDGEFVLDPTARPESRTIHDPTEALLLEGMRLFDESHRAT